MLTDLDYELLSNYLDDALDSVQRADLETRLNDEAELRRELEALRGTVALINALPPRKAPRNFTLDARMARRPAAARRTFFSPVLVSALSAAAAVLLIGFGLLSLTSNQSAAPQAVSFGAQAQQGVAQVPTASPLEKTDNGIDDGSLALTTTEEAPSPVLGTVLSDTEAPTVDLLDQASGGGALLDTETPTVSLLFNQPNGSGEPTGTFSREQQDAQPPPASLPSDAVANAATLSDENTVDAPFFAPSVPVGTIEGYTTGFPGAESNVVQGQNAQTGAAEIAAQSNPAVAPTFVLPTQGALANLAQEAAQATIITAMPTPTEISTETATPTDTPVPPTPSLEPTALRTSEPASSVELTPLVSLIAGIILLLVALVFYLRSRRDA